MTKQAKKLEFCLNGHRQPKNGSKFCIYCGKTVRRMPNQMGDRKRQQTVQQNPQMNQPVPQKQVQPNRPQQNNPAPPPPNNFVSPKNPPVPVRPNIQPMPARQPQIQALDCYACGGNGQILDKKTVICKECRWLRPLVPGYRVDSSAFEWAADAKAMSALRSMKSLTKAAKMVSEKVGRPWIESTFNGILLGEKQMPQIYGQAVKAARILGMSHMPDIYLSGERPWDCLTFGTEKDSFIVIGSALAGNFQGPDLFFLLAREMGHCQAGHALWQSVMRFLIGEQSQAKGFMAGGIMNALKSPGQLVVNAVEVPLLAWARQAEITADRAGLLCVGSRDIARRVLISWSLRSSYLFRQINIEAWLEQQAASEEDGYSKLSELTTSSTPYLSRRLRLLSEFSRSRELKYWRKLITDTIRKSAPPKPKKEAQKTSDFIGVKCSVCKTLMKVPLKALSEDKELPVKCPKKECGKITKLKKNIKPLKKLQVAKPSKQEELMNYGD